MRQHGGVYLKVLSFEIKGFGLVDLHVYILALVVFAELTELSWSEHLVHEVRISVGGLHKVLEVNGLVVEVVPHVHFLV